MFTEHGCVAALRMALSTVATIVGAPAAIAFIQRFVDATRMRFPIQSLFSRLLAVFVWSAAAVLVVPAHISIAQAAPLHCEAAATSSLDAFDNSPLLTSQKPLILIHGWHSDNSIWTNLKNYFNNSPDAANLRGDYKLYLFSYPSDTLLLPLLGQALGDALDCANRNEPNFGNQKIAIIGKSLGGLIARNFMQEQIQKDGIFSHSLGGEKVLRLITLGTPHHGTPIANGYSRITFTSLKDWFSLTILDSLLSLGGVFQGPLDFYNSPNRFDLHWDNYDRVRWSP